MLLNKKRTKISNFLTDFLPVSHWYDHYFLKNGKKYPIRDHSGGGIYPPRIAARKPPCSRSGVLYAVWCCCMATEKAA